MTVHFPAFYNTENVLCFANLQSAPLPSELISSSSSSSSTSAAAAAAAASSLLQMGGKAPTNK